MLGFLDAAVSVAYHIVIVLAHVLVPLTGGLATAAAIVAFTAGIRLLLVPLSYYALRGQAKQARLAPQVAELRRRHARHPDRLQRELADSTSGRAACSPDACRCCCSCRSSPSCTGCSGPAPWPAIRTRC